MLQGSYSSAYNFEIVSKWLSPEPLVELISVDSPQDKLLAVPLLLLLRIGGCLRPTPLSFLGLLGKLSSTILLLAYVQKAGWQAESVLLILCLQ